MEQLNADFWSRVTEYGPVVLKAVATLVVGWIVARVLRAVVRRVLRKANVDRTLASFASSLTYALLMTLVIISTIQALGVPTTSFVAVVGAAGLAIGLSLQGSLGNFAAGVMLIVFHPFKAGDYIEAGGAGGVVDELQIFATVLKTPDNKRVVVPNSAITGGTITNYSAHETRRVDLVFGIGYGDDIKKAKQTIEGLLEQDERVLKDPAPMIAVSELADSSVNLVVRPWVKTSDYWGVLTSLTESVKQRFDEENISIPFPQRDVHLHQVA